MREDKILESYYRDNINYYSAIKKSRETANISKNIKFTKTSTNKRTIKISKLSLHIPFTIVHISIFYCDKGSYTYNFIVPLADLLKM